MPLGASLSAFREKVITSCIRSSSPRRVANALNTGVLQCLLVNQHSSELRVIYIVL